MLKSLPPVGNPILLASVAEPEKVFESVFGDRSVFLYGSGTMALAASLVAAREFHRSKALEVILPAYACPDLVSAVLFAGLKPVLIDLEAGTPWMNLDRLKNQVSPNTLAVIATHFLGIPERLQDIRKVLERTDALIIEDSAQLFPTKPSDDVWEGDLVTLSFGRGKPVSLLGGGAVLSRNPSLTKHLPLADEAILQVSNNKPGRPGTLYKLKANIYNNLLSPDAYGLLQYVPFIHLGETVYKPLKEIWPFEVERVGVLAANIDAYRRQERKQQDWLSAMLGNINVAFISDLTSISATKFDHPLLRYPALVKDNSLRERLFEALSQEGLGCSRMYPKSLPEIDGLEGCFQGQGEFPQARLFSRRLLTLPCHSGVICDDVDLMKCVIEKTYYDELN